MRTVVGLFNSREAAENAIHRLMAEGVDRNSISIAMRDAREAADITQANDLSTEGATAGLVSGAGVGALVGIALLGSNLLLPGIGTVLIAGPIAAALTGAGIGAASGTLIGGLIGSGIPEDEAGHFAGGIEQGGIFVSAHVPEGQVIEARRVFDDEGSQRTYAP